MHPKLEAYLTQYGVTHDAFLKKGRPNNDIVSVRSAVISDLHAQGVSWAEMQSITGLSNGTIQRLTTQKRCPAVMQAAQERMAELGRNKKDVPKPKLSESLRKMWREGAFEFHRGKRDAAFCAKLKKSFTPERRARISARMRSQWCVTRYRENLLAFHRSPEQRSIRSRNLTDYLLKHPKMMHGRGSYVDTTKCSNGSRIWVRSRMEADAVSRLEADVSVISYQYEYRFEQCDRHYLPDFIVYYTDKIVMVEVKPRWVVESGLQKEKLAIYEKHALEQGWGFEIWSLS